MDRVDPHPCSAVSVEEPPDSSISDRRWYQAKEKLIGEHRGYPFIDIYIYTTTVRVIFTSNYEEFIEN